MKRPERFYKDEPNELAWTDPATGLKCLILRHDHLGFLCGYVRPPHALAKRLRAYRRQRSHFLFGKVGRKCGYDHRTIKGIQVHGGLTYSGTTLPGKGSGHTWVGFDCGHAGDLSPFMRQFMKIAGMHPGFMRADVYRDFAYVQQECTRLAAQIAAIKA